MGKREITKAIVGTLLLGAPVAGLAQAGWVPGSEITGQSVPGTWGAANGQLCLTTGAAQECWPYSQPFQAGRQIGLTSSCNSASRWTALGTNQAAPVQQGAGERG